MVALVGHKSTCKRLVHRDLQVRALRIQSILPLPTWSFEFKNLRDFVRFRNSKEGHTTIACGK